jgi:hypothetical protein
MVVYGLNPLLRQHGLKSGLAPDHVVGISTLLTDGKGYLYKDRVLAQENPRYAGLDEKLLGKFRLTSRLHFPVPTYSGKIACIFDALGRSPYLTAGDSPGDLPMMAFSQHRLWISRLEKPDYQQAACAQMESIGGSWLAQPTLTKRSPGFVRSLDEVSERLGTVPSAIRRSMRLMSGR